jgi:hypothetical protein
VLVDPLPDARTFSLTAREACSVNLQMQEKNRLEPNLCFLVRQYLRAKNVINKVMHFTVPTNLPVTAQVVEDPCPRCLPGIDRNLAHFYQIINLIL